MFQVSKISENDGVLMFQEEVLMYFTTLSTTLPVSGDNSYSPTIVFFDIYEQKEIHVQDSKIEYIKPHLIHHVQRGRSDIVII